MKNRLFSLILAVCVTCSFALALSASAVVDGTPATDSVTADMFSPENPAHPYAPDPFAIHPNWSTDSPSTHQFITTNAITIVKNAYPSSPLGNYITTLKSYSDYPDTPASGQNDNGTFIGHFYNPDTGRTWTGVTNPTAKTRLIWWYNNAVSEYKAGKATSAMESLGCALHYAADLSTPHHACSATSFLRNWDSILEKKRANLRSISEPARLRQPPPQKHGSGTRKRAGSKHTRGATNSRPSRAFCPLVG